jgi:hypothetical protein
VSVYSKYIRALTFENICFCARRELGCCRLLCKSPLDLLTHKRDPLTHKRDLLTQKIDLLTYKRDLLTHKRDLLTYKRDLLTHNVGLTLTSFFFLLFFQLLSEALGGDQLAAVYVLLTLVSKTVSRPHKSMVVGKFSLGLMCVCVCVCV